MDRLLLPCVLLFVMLAVAPAASAMPVDPVAVSAQQSCSIVGTERSDRLAGTGADDRVCGLGGADRIQGGGGGDVLRGGGGGDLLQGKSGRDRMEGGPGNDRVFGGAGADDLRGGAGRDALGGGLGPDELSGGPGRDIAYFGQRRLPVRVTIGAGANDGTAGEGDDVHADVEGIQAGPGNDVVRGNGGANRLIGAGGNDQLFGGRGNDVLVGGDGDDRLDAREGATATGRAAQAASVDRVVCGGGTDTALVDPVDIVDPGCENVIGGGGSTPPQNPPVQNPPAPNPPAPTRPGQPTITTTVAALAFTEGDSATLVDPGLAVADADDTDLQGATVRISVGFQAGDVLSFAGQPGISGTYSAGTLTLTGPSSVADYQAVLRSVRYEHTGDSPAAAKTAEFRADDGEGLGPAGTREISVEAMDDAPDAVDDAVSGGEDSGAGAVDVLANDTDVDGGSKMIASTSDASNGTVALTGGGTGLTYEPDPDYCGPDSFTYALNGGDSATVSVAVTCAPDDPVVDTSTGSTSYTENGAATPIDAAVTVGDVDVGTMIAGATVEVTGNYAGAEDILALAGSHPSITASVSGDTLTLTGDSSAAAYQLALRDVIYRNGSDAPSTAARTVTFTVTDATSRTGSDTKDIAVGALEDPPTAVNDSATVAEDAAATGVDVLANDTDVDGGPRSVSAVTQPTNGTVVITGGGTGLTYRPNLGYCNDPPGTMPDVFTYTLNGGSTATVSVTVTCNDDAPTAVDDSATVAEDSPASAIGVLANDTDTDGGPRSVASVTQPANGAVVITGGGSGLTYQPNANYCNSQAGGAPDTFTYTLNGGDSATVSVTVTCVDDPPTAVNDSATVVEDSAAGAVVVLANDLNADGGPITIASASDPANGTVAVTGGGTGLTYQPDANFCGPDTFTYTLTGGSTATVAMTVTCAPDNPVVDTSAGSASYTENAAATVIDAAVTVSDVDAGTTITGATVKITGGYAGAEDILALGGTHPGITPVVSGDTLTLSGNASVAAYQAALRAVTYRNGSDAPSTAPRTVTFTVTDDTARTGSDTKGVTVSAVDDPPTAVADSATVLEDAAATAVAVLTNDTDVDAGPRSVASVTQPANGTVAITGGGTGLTYQPNANYCNTPPGTTLSTFTYTLNGGSSATVSVTVTCVNDAPVADDETFDGANGAIGNTSLVVNDPDDGAPALGSPKKSISGDILAGDSDIDGPGPLTVTAGTFATNDGGQVTIEADGDFIYINDPADNCADTSDFFDYTLSDQNPAGPGPAPGTDTGRVTIAVAGCVWYVSNNATGNSGSSVAPFDTLTQAETASAANHTVFVFDGDNTSTGYGGNGYTMNAGERLIGEHEGLTVDPDQGGPLASQTLHPANPGAHPTLTATGADVIDLDDANEVRGLTIDPQGAGGGIAGSTGDVSGTIDDVNIADTGTAGTQPGLELDSTTGTFAVSNLTVNTTGATGVRLNNAGTVTFAPTGNISITTTGAAGLDASGTTLGTSTFDTVTVTGSTNGGVRIANATAASATTFGALSLTTTSGTTPAFRLDSAGTVTVAAAGTANVSATGGPAVDATGLTGGSDLALDTVTASGNPTKGINLDGTGNWTFSAGTGSAIGATSQVGLDVNGGSGTVSYSGTIANGTGAAVDVTGRSGNTTISGNITGAGGTGVNVANNTAGTTTFSGTTKTINTATNQAVTLTNNGGHTIAFTGGGLDVDTTSGTGFNATGGGTVTVQDAGNTIFANGSGSALNVTNTTIGAAGLIFQSISAGTATGSAGNGITLDTTGSSGGLTVTGTGTAGSGGTIRNKTGADGSTTSGIGVFLNSTSLVSLAWMQLNDFGNFGIYGQSVNGFALANSRITGTSGTSSGPGDAPIAFGKSNPSGVNGLVGANPNSVTDTEISGGIEHNFELYNQSGSFTLNVTRATIHDNTTAFGSDGILMETQGTSNGTITVDDSDFANNKSQAFQANALDSSTLTLTLTNSTATRTTQGNEGFIFSNGSSADLTATITNNTVTGINGANIFVGQVAGNATASSLLRATISGNTMTPPAPTNRTLIAFLTSTSGSTAQAVARLLIQGNTINTVSDAANGLAEPLFVSTPDSNTAPRFDATVINNVVNINDQAATALRGIGVQATQGVAGQGATLCANVTGNDVNYSPAPPAGVNGVRVRQATPGGAATAPTLTLERRNSASSVASTVLADNNPLSTTEVLGTATVVNTGTCLLP